MLAAMAGHDPIDPSSSNRPVPDYTSALTGNIEGLRIGVVRNWYADEADPEITAAIDTAVALLASLGATVEEIDLGDLQPYIDCKTLISSAELYAVHAQNMQRASRRLQPEAAPARAGRRPGPRRGLPARRPLARRISPASCLRPMPASTSWPPPAGSRPPPRSDPEGVDFFKGLRLVTMPFSLAGNPALVLPCGFSLGGPADLVATRRPAVRRGDRLPLRRRLPARNRLAPPRAGTGLEGDTDGLAPTRDEILADWPASLASTCRRVPRRPVPRPRPRAGHAGPPAAQPRPWRRTSARVRPTSLHAVSR